MGNSPNPHTIVHSCLSRSSIILRCVSFALADYFSTNLHLRSLAVEETDEIPLESAATSGI
jgi:hypothetical protein